MKSYLLDFFPAIKRIDRKEEFRNQANTSFTIEIDKLG
jgi:hypothetical protein